MRPAGDAGSKASSEPAGIYLASELQPPLASALILDLNQRNQQRRNPLRVLVAWYVRRLPATWGNGRPEALYWLNSALGTT